MRLVHSGIGSLFLSSFLGLLFGVLSIAMLIMAVTGGAMSAAVLGVGFAGMALFGTMSLAVVTRHRIWINPIHGAPIKWGAQQRLEEHGSYVYVYVQGRKRKVVALVQPEYLIGTGEKVSVARHRLEVAFEAFADQ